MRKGRGPTGALPIVLTVAAILAVLVVAALLFGPEREAPPPPSIAAPQERPQRPDRVEDATPARPGAPLDTGADAVPVATPEEPATEAAGFIIRGRVSAAANGEPVADAQVRIEPARVGAMATPGRGRGPRALRERGRRGIPVIAHARTDESGYFELNPGEPGDYRLEVVHPSFIPATRELPALNADQPVAEIDIALSSGASITGRVTEAGTSHGAAGVGVSVENSRQPPVETATDGTYTIAGLTTGEYGVTLNLSGTAYRTAEVLPYRKVTIASPDETVRGIDFTVEAAGVVWGYVLDRTRQPVPGAEVVLCTSQSVASQALSAALERAPMIGSRAQNDGYYELLGVPLNEEWRVHVTAEKHAPQLADPFRLGGAVREVRVDVFLYGGAKISGRTVEPRGAAVPNAQVLCIPAFGALFSPLDTPQAYRTATSDDAGNFTIDELPAGDYQILARKDGYKFSMRGTGFYSNGYSDVTGLRVTLEPVEEGTHEIFGIVFGPGQEPLSGVSVSLRGVGAESLSGGEQSASTGGDGRFHFHGVEKGVHTLTAEKDGYGPQTLRNVPLDREVRVVLNTLAVVRGRVLVREKEQAPPAYSVAAVSLADAQSSGAQLLRAFEPVESWNFNDPEGRFEVRLAEGDYRLEGRAPEHTPGQLPVSLEAGQIMEDVVLYVSEDGGRIAGRVTTADGQNPQGALVTLVDAGAALGDAAMLAAAADGGRSMRVGEDGAFAFEQLPEGQYFVMAQHERYATGRSEAIFLPENGEESNVVVLLSFGGAIEGAFTMHGRAMAGAVITAIGEGEPQVTETDQNGFFRIEGLAPGNYVVTAAPLGGGNLAGLLDMRMERVTVEDGATATVTFEGGGATIEGYCTPPPPAAPFGAGGFAALRFPGPGPVPLGGNANLFALFQGAAPLKTAVVDTSGFFTLTNVPPGEYQLDVYYGQLDLRYVYTAIIPVEGEEVISFDVPVELF